MSRKSHFHRSARRSDDQHIARRRRGLRVEPLEDRRLLAIFVDNLIDEADGSITDGDISLRDAIALAPAGETIGFVSGGTIDLTLGELVIDKDLTISAGSGLQLTIDAQNNSRIFNITGGNVGISSLTLTRGRADDPFDESWWSNKESRQSYHYVIDDHFQLCLFRRWDCQRQGGRPHHHR